jgi:hypothetical protein
VFPGPLEPRLDPVRVFVVFDHPAVFVVSDPAVVWIWHPAGTSARIALVFALQCLPQLIDLAASLVDSLVRHLDFVVGALVDWISLGAEELPFFSGLLMEKLLSVGLLVALVALLPCFDVHCALVTVRHAVSVLEVLVNAELPFSAV